MTILTHTDVVAANMRNALLDANQVNLFEKTDREADRYDAMYLEASYQMIDQRLQSEDVELFYTAICKGHEMQFDTEKADFFVI